MARAPRRKSGKVYIPHKIAADVGGRILSGSLKPGTTLGTEATASVRHLVSRAAYREAIRILGAKGLVEAWPKVGTRVAMPEAWHLLDPDVLNWMFVRDPKLEAIVALFELRSIIEPQIAAMAARRRSLSQLVEMGASLDVMARATLKTEEGRRADEAFHAKLIEASGNPFLISLSSSVINAIIGSTTYKHRTGRLERDSLPDHMKVFEAIAAGDGEASAAAMRELIRLALSDATQPSARGRRSG